MICNKFGNCIEEELKNQIIKGCSNKNHSHCVEVSDQRAEVKCEEKGKKYILQNSRREKVVSYKLDGGVIVMDATVPLQTRKSDYLFINNSREAIIIELKGKNIQKALEQIDGTIKIYQKIFEKCNHVYGRAIVSSSVPNLRATPEYVNLNQKLVMKYRGNIKIRERQFKEKDTELGIKS